MTKFSEIALNGLALGSVYALIALGFVVIFKASGVMNFAHGSLLLLGGYVIAELHDDLGFAGAVLVGVLVTAAGAGLMELLFIRGLGTVDLHVLTILTIGIDILLTTELVRRIGSDTLSLGDPWGNGSVRIGSAYIAEARIASIVVATILIGFFFAAFRYTAWGLSMRAASEDREAAALMGVSMKRVQLVAWCVAGALAAVAAVFLTAAPTSGLDRTTGQIALKAFPAAVLGGMDSAPGALVGALMIGLAEALAAGYQSELDVLGGGVSGIAPYIVMILILLWRPTGLLGSKELSRV
ncbi:branched-chain amino acid ABC transporter permease [Yinghuangia sp. ASG 101]|uniref:branched-chain amino acid ABC transporter permease n=1 Tax=Yinghuangia sp. ASG 101 TaxID=2896848 RepID=UPI001E31F18C|nr:branched-chain amino acid ABC transporter permease [Yinghuangia sp. ASG 101]UGQ14321.1 branched-chain amino acid ABC transporter permease [Yinghuangia sp. ASG 101]